jgi:hypothetical protein
VDEGSWWADGGDADSPLRRVRGHFCRCRGPLVVLDNVDADLLGLGHVAVPFLIDSLRWAKVPSGLYWSKR